MTYEWKDIQKIDYPTALQRWNSDKEVFLLYEDGTEGLAQSLSEIQWHYTKNGELGYEK